MDGTLNRSVAAPTTTLKAVDLAHCPFWLQFCRFARTSLGVCMDPTRKCSCPFSANAQTSSSWGSLE